MAEKLFDIALKYLDKLDFSSISLSGERKELSFYERLDFQILNETTLSRQDMFKANVCTRGYTEYYVDLIFAAAVYHMIFKANKLLSYFDVAFEIVEAHKNILMDGKFERYGNSIYPKVMMDAWVSYCNSKKNIAQFQKDSAFRIDLFCVVYHHLLGEEQLVPYSILMND